MKHYVIARSDKDTGKCEYLIVNSPDKSDGSVILRAFVEAEVGNAVEWVEGLTEEQMKATDWTAYEIDDRAENAWILELGNKTHANAFAAMDYANQMAKERAAVAQIVAQAMACEESAKAWNAIDWLSDTMEEAKAKAIEARGYRIDGLIAYGQAACEDIVPNALKEPILERVLELALDELDESAAEVKEGVSEEITSRTLAAWPFYKENQAVTEQIASIREDLEAEAKNAEAKAEALEEEAENERSRARYIREAIGQW